MFVLAWSNQQVDQRLQTGCIRQILPQPRINGALPELTSLRAGDAGA